MENLLGCNIFKFNVGDKVNVIGTIREGEIKEQYYSLRVIGGQVFEDCSYKVLINGGNNTHKEDTLRHADEVDYKAELVICEVMINNNYGVNDEAVIYYNDLKNKIIKENKKTK